ncbi:mannosyltransferase [Orbilia oligospora]|uniref:Chitobiosyldiphosphodolichol beta-mannosyltransferase n=1 Tax=Orbilia oligospora TaxID=2813651 RepID=A0A6G1MI60_ORBOL|nr:mannosyltransferase [Orbilia oligospora]KAF3226788.1 mannosyltransferase [Orbilia oligospora]KAF3229508.1 mannosyltransferase [Orbilia oligospora]KAF3258347.1 mannosyltransferase [Orbilia oligospora]
MGSLDTLLPLVTLTSIILTAAILCLPSRNTHSHTQGKEKKGRVAVLVLGDIGRSPRMQYHALSLAANGWAVDLIGYDESTPRPEILSSPDIRIIPLPPPPPVLGVSSKALFPIIAPFKVLFQLSALFYLLFYIIRPPSYILVQNPPSIPTLLVARITAFVRNSRLVIDWHNFGYSILALKLGDDHPLVRISKWYETKFGNSAYANFTVTDQMRKVLRQDWRITTPILTLHDRPPTIFQPLDHKQRDAFLSTHRLTAQNVPFDNTKLLISSTSWTPDEDFSILFAALQYYTTTVKKSPLSAKLPNILAVITGKGPLLKHYEPLINELNESKSCVTIRTEFLPAEEYPKLLASADLGVCLHTSSSGVDLPMKVVDMFGVGIPVAAVKFEAIGELVKDGINGVVFEAGVNPGQTKGEELGDILVRLFGDSNELEVLKEGAMKEVERRWEGEWDEIAKGVFEGKAKSQ